jgi:ion channel POLLUX/CASTOR
MNHPGPNPQSSTSKASTSQGKRFVAPPSPSFGKKLRYRFDTALSKGPWVVVGWLGLLTLIIILVSAAILTLTGLSGIGGGKSLGPFEAFWQSLLRVLDAGSFAGDTNWWTRVLTLLVTLAGIFIAGSLIGLIATTVDQNIEELRKGRSAVLETDHTLILGWSERVPAIVRELTIANESRKGAAIVILALEEKDAMEEVLRDAISDTRGTRVVCRRGDPSDLASLGLVNYQACRSVVIVEGPGGAAATVKTLLALRAIDPALSNSHVVAEISDSDTAKSLSSLIGKQLVTVNSDDVVAELTAQACRQRGLSTVFHELLDFDGDEIYFAPFQQVTGRTYAEAQLGFAACTIMGRVRADGTVELNPPAAAIIQAGDQLIGMASDDSDFMFTGFMTANALEVPERSVEEPARRRIIVVGWSALGPRVVMELDEFLGAHTTVEILIDPEQVDVASVRASIDPKIMTVEVAELSGGPERIAEHAARKAFDEVIVLGYRQNLTIEEADARTLLTLLAFHRVRERLNIGRVRMVAELLDQRHAALAEATGADDFIVSDELTSLMLAQLSERKELNEVFSDLFDSNGCTIALLPAGNYAAEKAKTFGEIIATASASGDSALGFRRNATGEVVVNPKRDSAPLLTLDDQVLVLSSPRQM